MPDAPPVLTVAARTAVQTGQDAEVAERMLAAGDPGRYQPLTALTGRRRRLGLCVSVWEVEQSVVHDTAPKSNPTAIGFVSRPTISGR